MQYKGHVDIPNLSDENSVDEVEVCASQFLIYLSLPRPLILMREMTYSFKITVLAWPEHSETQSADDVLGLWCHWELPEQLVLI